MDYYNPAYQLDEEENTPIAISIVPIYIYRSCQKQFKSNNLLYKHMRARECSPKPSATAPVAFNSTIEIIPSTTPITDLSTGFGFRSYHFLTLLIALSVAAIAVSVYLDIDYLVTLINRAFLLKQIPGIYIRTIALPISVRGISTNYYSTNEYVLLEIYLLGTRNGKNIRAKITREAYLVNSLKVKMLLGTNIIGPKKIDIIASKN